MKPAYIYIITDGDNNFKVGLTKSDPEKRLKQLQTGHPKKLTIHSYFKVPLDKVFELEKLAHKELQSKYQKRGEWFKNGNGWYINLLVDMICENYLIED